MFFSVSDKLIFNNLNSMKKDYNELIELFITSKKNISNIIHYDVEKTKHIDIYMDYIHDSLETFGGYNYAKEVIFELKERHGHKYEEIF